MTALPDRTNGTTGIVDAVTNLQQKANLGNLRDYLAGLFGADGVKATARTELDVPQIAAVILKSIIVAKGDLIAGTGASAPGILSAGANGKVLTADDTKPGGMDWVTPTSGGTTIPAGTRMLFNQTSAPNGFTKETGAAYNNKALRIVTGTVGSGGASDFSSVFGSGRITGTHGLTIANLPSGIIGSFSANTGYVSNDHAHYVSGQTGGQSNDHSHGGVITSLNTSGQYGSGFDSAVSSGNGGNTGGVSADHSHSFGAWSGGINNNHYHAVSGSVSSAGSAVAHSHSLSLDIAYHDIIIAVKD